MFKRLGALTGWLLPVSYRLTPAGWLWLLLAAPILIIGVTKNIGFLAFLGWFLFALLLLNAIFAGRRLGLLAAHRHTEELLFAGANCHVEIRIAHGGSKPCRGVCIEDGGVCAPLAWYFDVAPGSSKWVCAGETRLPERGWQTWGPLIASSAYPFGLVRRQVTLVPASRVLVLPLPGKIDREQLRQQLRGADPRGERVRRRGWRHEGAQADFHGLRPFRPGDSPRWIHWRTTARRGQIMVREFEDVPGDDLILVLADTNSATVTEAVITAAAGVCWEWCRRRGDRLILIAGSTLLDGIAGPEHARALLACLAELPADRMPAPDLTSLRDLPLTLAVVVVSGSNSALVGEVAALVGRRVTVLVKDED